MPQFGTSTYNRIIFDGRAWHGRQAVSVGKRGAPACPVSRRAGGGLLSVVLVTRDWSTLAVAEVGRVVDGMPGTER